MTEARFPKRRGGGSFAVFARFVTSSMPLRLLSALLVLLAGCGGKLASAGGGQETPSTPADASNDQPTSAGSETPDATPTPVFDEAGDDGAPGRAPADASSSGVGLGDTGPCLAGGNLLYFEGPNFTTTQSLLVSDATWMATDVAYEEDVAVAAVQGEGATATVYTVRFSSEGLGTPLAVGLYANAGLAPGVVAGKPGMGVSGGDTDCSPLEGSFRLDTMAWNSDGGVGAITAAFEAVCAGETANPIRGCVHYAFGGQ